MSLALSDDILTCVLTLSFLNFATLSFIGLIEDLLFFISFSIFSPISFSSE